MTNIAIIYYSSTGSVHTLAQAFALGAQTTGAEVRLRRAAELVQDAIVAGNDAWANHLAETRHIPEATVDDLVWADGFAIGTPTRFGQPASQIKQFLDATSQAWNAGHLANKPATGFTSSYERHGGQESTLLALYHTFYHWGSLILPTGYVNYDLSHAAGGNPYGVSSISEDGKPGEDVLALAFYQGQRLAELSTVLAHTREGVPA